MKFMTNYKWFDPGFHPFVNICFYSVKLKNIHFFSIQTNLFDKKWISGLSNAVNSVSVLNTDN